MTTMTRIEEREVSEMQQTVKIIVGLARLKSFAMGDLTDEETKAIDWLEHVYMIGRGGKHA